MRRPIRYRKIRRRIYPSQSNRSYGAKDPDWHFELTFKVSAPSFEDFDETKDLVSFINFLKKLAGKDNTIEVVEVTKGSVLVKVQNDLQRIR